MPLGKDKYKGVRIHETAIIEDGVEIGEGSVIWDNAHIRKNTRIGKNCIIGEKTYIAYNVQIGNLVKINSFVDQQSKAESISESEEINVGDTVKVDMGVVTKYDNLPQYLGLVRAAIKNGGGRVEVADVKDGKAEIVGGPREKFLGGPWVPIDALRKMGATVAGGGESHGAGGFAT